MKLCQGIYSLPRLLSGTEAASAIRRGIIQATRDCEAWGGDWPSDRGCENLLQVRAAEAIFSVLKAQGLGSVTLEEPVSSISSWGTSKRGPRFRGMTDQQRVDLAIWSKSDRIYGAVEIKRNQSEIDWECDLKKLCNLLDTYGRKHSNHLRYGILGAFIAGATGAAADRRAQSLANLPRTTAKNYRVRVRIEVDQDFHHWNQELGPADWTCRAATVTITI